MILPIDSEALVEAIRSYAPCDYDALEVHEILRIIDQQPTLVFSGLRLFGEWEAFDDNSGEVLSIGDDQGATHWACSLCEETIIFAKPVEKTYLSNFCPRCGARMREVLHP